MTSDYGPTLKLLQVNGLNAQSSRDQIRDLLSKAKYSPSEIDAFYVYLDTPQVPYVEKAQVVAPKVEEKLKATHDFGSFISFFINIGLGIAALFVVYILREKGFFTEILPGF